MTSSEIRFVNAIIGFCTPTGGTWPAPLAKLGYVACGIERQIKTLVDGADRTVTVDLICASSQTHHALCVEAKSATLDADQARRYQALTSRNILRLGALPPEIDPSRLTHDVAYVAHRDHTPALIRQFDAVPIMLPIVAGDDGLFDLAHGAFGDEDVQGVFVDGVLVDARSWPHHFVPFKSDSPDRDVVPAVAQALARFIIRGQDFDIAQLAERSVPHWPLCGDGERHAFRAKLAGLVDRAMREELVEFYERRGAAQAWRIKGPRLTRPGQTERLGRLTTEFVERAQSGSPPKPVQLRLDPLPGPLPFLDDDADDDDREESIDEELV